MIDPIVLLFIGLIIVVGGIILLRLHPFLALIAAVIIIGLLTSEQNLMDYAASKGYSDFETGILLKKTVGQRTAEAFGDTVTKIGILIAMASIIAGCLFKSGAADKIVRHLLKILGVKRAPLAFLGGSFFLAIPVYFDTVFYLMFPLARMMAVRKKEDYAWYVMAIIAGGIMAHSLVPPTPGPLFVASALGVNLSAMILAGIFVGAITAYSGFLYAKVINRKYPLELRDSESGSMKELEERVKVRDEDLPPFWLAIMPILAPLLLIAGNTTLQTIYGNSAGATMELVLGFFAFLGNANIALTLAAAIAILLLVRFGGKQEQGSVTIRKLVQDSLSQAGIIILITGAGGAFGSLLQQTGITVRLGEIIGIGNTAILPLAFLATALIRTAQGSATVAMITTVGILGGLVEGGALNFHPVYLALTIGCGSKIFPWMNDSGFWIINQMSRMTEKETLRYMSGMSAVMGFTGLIVCMILAWLLPFGI